MARLFCTVIHSPAAWIFLKAGFGSSRSNPPPIGNSIKYYVHTSPGVQPKERPTVTYLALEVSR
jgi:hypothetical protein